MRIIVAVSGEEWIFYSTIKKKENSDVVWERLYNKKYKASAITTKNSLLVVIPDAL